MGYDDPDGKGCAKAFLMLVLIILCAGLLIGIPLGSLLIHLVSR